MHIRIVSADRTLGWKMRDDCIDRTMHAGYQFKRSRLDQRQQNSTRANQNMGQLDTTTTTMNAIALAFDYSRCDV